MRRHLGIERREWVAGVQISSRKIFLKIRTLHFFLLTVTADAAFPSQKVQGGRLDQSGTEEICAKYGSARVVIKASGEQPKRCSFGLGFYWERSKK